MFLADRQVCQTNQRPCSQVRVTGIGIRERPLQHRNAHLPVVERPHVPKRTRELYELPGSAGGVEPTQGCDEIWQVQKPPMNLSNQGEILQIARPNFVAKLHSPVSMPVSDCVGLVGIAVEQFEPERT